MSIPNTADVKEDPERGAKSNFYKEAIMESKISKIESMFQGFMNRYESDQKKQDIEKKKTETRFEDLIKSRERTQKSSAKNRKMSPDKDSSSSQSGESVSSKPTIIPGSTSHYTKRNPMKEKSKVFPEGINVSIDDFNDTEEEEEIYAERENKRKDKSSRRHSFNLDPSDQAPTNPLKSKDDDDDLPPNVSNRRSSKSYNAGKSNSTPAPPQVVHETITVYNQVEIPKKRYVIFESS